MKEARAPEGGEHLKVGDIYLAFDAGKDRRRMVTKALRNPATARKDENRNMQRMITIFCSEDSVRARRGTVRGTVQTAQHAHLIFNAQTPIAFKKYPSYEDCSALGDKIGPVALNTADQLPKKPKAEKIKYWAKRRVPAGGHADSSDSGDNAPDDDAACPLPTTPCLCN